jgi:hypothetical protein
MRNFKMHEINQINVYQKYDTTEIATEKYEKFKGCFDNIKTCETTSLDHTIKYAESFIYEFSTIDSEIELECGIEYKPASMHLEIKMDITEFKELEKLESIIKNAIECFKK